MKYSKWNHNLLYLITFDLDPTNIYNYFLWISSFIKNHKYHKESHPLQKSTSTETYFRRMADIEEKFYTIWKTMSLNDSMDQIERAKLAVWDYPVYNIM